MIGTLLGIVLALVILGAIWWGAQQLLALIPMAEPFATIVRVVIVLIGVFVVVWVLVQLLTAAGFAPRFGSLRLSDYGILMLG